MPIIAAARIPGKGIIAKNSFYCEEKRQGVLAHFLGPGFRQGRTGWHLLVASEASEQEFDAHTVHFALVVAFEMGIDPSALFAAP